MSTSSFQLFAPHRRRRRRGAAAVLAVVARTAASVALAGLLTAGCSFTLDSGSGAEGATPGGGTAVTTPAQDADASSTPAPGDATPAPDGEATPAGGSGSAAQAGSPQDQNLDIELVHPNGTSLSISKLSFKDNDIYLDVEAINSARWEVKLHRSNNGNDRMRLVDDAGQEYNFVELEGDPPIGLAPGETLTGTLAFRGPLRGQPNQLSLVTNLQPEEIAGYSLEEQPDGDRSPEFVVPMDLVWG